MKSGRFAALFLGAAALLSFATPASAGTRIYGVTLTGAQEVPAVTPSGIGVATVTLNDVTGAVSVSGSYSGMTSNVTLSHIHGLAAPGANAGIIVNLTPSGGTSGTFSGSGVLSPANLTGMLNGLTYLNVHTTINGGGEIRGQITTQVPALPWTWMVALTALALGGGAFVLTRRPRAATVLA